MIWRYDPRVARDSAPAAVNRAPRLGGELQEKHHDRAQDTHLHHPGPRNGGVRPPLGDSRPLTFARGIGAITLAAGVAAAPRGGRVVSLVRGSVHLRWQGYASANRRAGLPGKGRPVSV